FEQRPYRLQITLSDVNGIDPHIHEGRPTRVLHSVLNCFAGSGAPSFAALDRLRLDLVRGVRRHKRDAGAATILSRQLFRQSVATATSLAVEHGLLRAR
ncbi:MAG TPA: hypothetical protein VHB97_01115, partial [Polyangia bacterium]|nr:hypothetical protein [Polyangia bacterium]